MNDPERYDFREIDNSIGSASNLPYLPLILTHRGHSLSVEGLLDTGSAVNVLPFDIGRELGASWEQQTTLVKLTGNLAQLEARVLIVSATVGQFPLARLAFAWTLSDEIPLILGQINFFLEFDVCFYRSRSFLEIRPKQR